MVPKYSRLLKQRQINTDTGAVWAIQDVPPTWNARTKAKVEADHYYFAEDGTAYPVPPNEEA